MSRVSKKLTLLKLVQLHTDTSLNSLPKKEKDMNAIGIS